MGFRTGGHHHQRTLESLGNLRGFFSSASCTPEFFLVLEFFIWGGVGPEPNKITDSPRNAASFEGADCVLRRRCDSGYSFAPLVASLFLLAIGASPY
jgi:hypothetical protein